MWGHLIQVIWEAEVSEGREAEEGGLVLVAYPSGAFEHEHPSLWRPGSAMQTRIKESFTYM